MSTSTPFICQVRIVNVDNITNSYFCNRLNSGCFLAFVYKRTLKNESKVENTDSWGQLPKHSCLGAFVLSIMQLQKSLLACLLVFFRQHSSWAGGQPGPAGGDHWLPNSATFLRPGVPLVFPQTPCYSWRGAGNRVRLQLLSIILCHFGASSCNYELKAEGLTFSKWLSVVAVSQIIYEASFRWGGKGL